MTDNFKYCKNTQLDELKIITINHPLFSAKVSYQGAQIFEYSSSSFSLFTSSLAYFKNNRAIRGGIPLCWPWFGPKEDSISHGFARVFNWQLKSIKEDALHVELIWCLTSDSNSKKYFAYDFELELIQKISDTIELNLYVHNLDTQSFEVSEAFHTYFSIDTLNTLHVKELESKHFFNQLTCKDETEDNILFDKEIDRIYQEKISSITIDNNSKKISIEQENFHSVVVWNPWIEKSKSLIDMSNDEYKNMVCIESANVKERSVTIKRGEIHSVKLSIS